MSFLFLMGIAEATALEGGVGGEEDSPGVAIEVGKMKSSMFMRSEDGELVSFALARDSRSCAIPDGVAEATCCRFNLDLVSHVSGPAEWTVS